ncbi:MAG TPA: hypothetical protein VKB07_12050 [Gaiellaceae bacterium]|nr:hypothetical protein [Gaiellaceae bacterium]
MPEVLGDLVQRAAFVEEQRGAGVTQVVAAEVGHSGALECRNPDPPPPVLATEVAVLAVGEDERGAIGAAAGEVELDELARDRREQFGLAPALRLRRRDLIAGDCALDPQALPRPAAVVDDVAPQERVGLRRAQALVRQHADERRVLRVESGANRLDRLRRAGVDRLGATVGDTADADHRVPGETAPFDRAVEDTLQNSERSVDRRGARSVDAQSGRVAVDRLPGDLAQTLAAQVGDDPPVEQRRVSLERARAQVRDRVRVPPFDEELLECGVRADHLGGELPELARPPQRGLEELGVAATVEAALAPRAAPSALVPADDVDSPAVATPAPLDAHAAATVVDRQTTGRQPCLAEPPRWAVRLS